MGEEEIVKELVRLNKEIRHLRIYLSDIARRGDDDGELAKEGLRAWEEGNLLSRAV